MSWPEIYSCKLDAESRAAHLRDGLYARVVELVDTAVLETVAERLESSSLSLGTLFIINECSLPVNT